MDTARTEIKGGHVCRLGDPHLLRLPQQQQLQGERYHPVEEVV